jgi:hypothetical protein
VAGAHQTGQETTEPYTTYETGYGTETSHVTSYTTVTTTSPVTATQTSPATVSQSTVSSISTESTVAGAGNPPTGVNFVTIAIMSAASAAVALATRRKMR